jgi:Fe-S-cluster containining protein
MKCDHDCGKCCGPILCLSEELDRVTAYAAAHGIVPARQGITCPFFQAGGCAVYSVRPFVCQIFGHSPTLRCEHGHNVNISNEREQKLMDRYRRCGDPSASLHSLIYTDGELAAIVSDYVVNGEAKS